MRIPAIVSLGYTGAVAEEDGVLNWFGETPPFTDEEINAEVTRLLYSDTIKAKIEELNNACEERIVSGFTSSALGTPHTYQSERDDQTNLLGSVLDNLDSVYKCFDGVTWAYRPHTIAQLKQVLADGKLMKLGYLQQCGALKDQVYAINVNDSVTYPTPTDVTNAINAIVWPV